MPSLGCVSVCCTCHVGAGASRCGMRSVLEGAKSANHRAQQRHPGSAIQPEPRRCAGASRSVCICAMTAWCNKHKCVCMCVMTAWCSMVQQTQVARRSVWRSKLFGSRNTKHISFAVARGFSAPSPYDLALYGVARLVRLQHVEEDLLPHVKCAQCPRTAVCDEQGAHRYVDPLILQKYNMFVVMA
jgi:hypothetical protein